MIIATHGIVGSSIASFDTDALAFITATGITDSTQKNAINTLVLDLKSYGIWTKMKAIYPFVGGTASSHKWNLKDPRDLDAAFRLVFNGGGTHSSNGYQLNGTNSFADTKFIPSTSFISSSRSSFGIYSRTNGSTLLEGRTVMGSYAGSGWVLMYLKTSSLKQYALNNTDWGNFTSPNSTYVNKLGFFQSSRNNSSTTQLWRVNNTDYSHTSNATGLSTLSIYIGATNGLDINAYAENVQLAYAYIGDDLTTTDLSNYYTAVQNYETTLGRQV